jgi:hypothetical protein
MQPDVGGAIDLTHTAGSDRSCDPIVPNRLSDQVFPRERREYYGLARPESTH